MMSFPSASAITIGPCPASLRRAALELLLGETPADFRHAQVSTALETLENPAGEPGRLLVAAHQETTVLAAAMAVAQPGRTAIVHPPRLAAGQREALADRLLGEMNQWLDRNTVQVAQALLDPCDLLDADRLSRCGYVQACTLCYLVCAAEHFPQAQPQGPLAFEPWRPTDDAQFGPIMDATYENTLDCPSLNGVRATPDVLAGYRASPAGVNGPWTIANRAGRAAGCLLLADHEASDQYELMYMGIVPEFRGQGLGACLVRQAQWQAHCAGRTQLVLAVDAQNGPARDVYAAQGFRVFTERLVYLRTAST